MPKHRALAAVALRWGVFFADEAVAGVARRTVSATYRFFKERPSILGVGTLDAADLRPDTGEACETGALGALRIGAGTYCTARRRVVILRVQVRVPRDEIKKGDRI